MEPGNKQLNEEVMAKRKLLSLVSSVWLIPLVAIIIGLLIFMRYVQTTGPEITLYAQSGEGLKEGLSFIKMYDVEVGRITRISLNDDPGNQQGKVILKARMNADVSGFLRQDTTFWVVKPRIEQSSVSGLSTLISGSYIQMAPGSSEESAKVFTINDSAYYKDTNDKGINIKLTAELNNPVSAGAPVLFSGIEIGWVDNIHVDTAGKQISYDVYVKEIHRSIIGEKTTFWLTNGLNFNFDKSGVKLGQVSLGNLLTGAIAVGLPADGKVGKPAADGSRFKLYSSQSEVPYLPSDKAIEAVAFFTQDVSSLIPGSKVLYKGVAVGHVLQAPYFAAADKMQLFERRAVPVLFALEPALLNVTAAALPQWQQKIKTLLRRQLAVSITSSSLLFGEQYLDLVDDGGVVATGFRPQPQYADYPVVASVNNDLALLQQNINGFVTKLNSLPLAETTSSLNGSLKRLDKLLASVDKMLDSKEAQNIVPQLSATLQQINAVLAVLNPASAAQQGIGSIMKKLNATLQTAQPLLQKLVDKPNALIFDHKKADAYPRGAGNE